MQGTQQKLQGARCKVQGTQQKLQGARCKVQGDLSHPATSQRTTEQDLRVKERLYQVSTRI